MVLDKGFFNSSLFAEDKFNIGLKVTNGPGGIEAENSMFVKVNRAPENGSCVVGPLEGVALVTEFVLECSGWVDPEDVGIQHYVISGK